MTIMKAKYLMIATVATMLAACSNDENEVNNGPVEARITARMGAETRAVNDDPSSFAAGDEIGVMVTKVEQPQGDKTSNMVSRYKNVKYTTDKGSQSGSSATFGAKEGIFFQDATETVTFAAYYPYQTSTDAGTLPESDGVISVNTQENNTKTKEENKQAKIDFLFASGAKASKNSPKVEFKDNSGVSGSNCQFQHKMAQLKLIITASTSAGFTEDEAKAVCADASSYKLGGLIHQGTFTLKVESDGTASGTAAATGTAVDSWEITDCVHTDNTEETQRTYTLILLPQNKSNSALRFEANIGGQIYKNEKDIKPNLEAGNTYTYTITVRKKGLTVDNCDIQSWNPSTSGQGDAEM